MDMLEQANELSARTLASRANGAMSTGPKTEAGKAISSRNAVKHGFRSEKIFTETEEQELHFQTVRLAMLEELNPSGPMQWTLAERYILCNWREVRVVDAQTSLLNECFQNGDSYHAAYTLEAKKLAALHRYEMAYRREMRTCLNELRALQQKAEWDALHVYPNDLSDENKDDWGDRVLTIQQPNSELEPTSPKPDSEHEHPNNGTEASETTTPEQDFIISYQTNPSATQTTARPQRQIPTEPRPISAGPRKPEDYEKYDRR